MKEYVVELGNDGGQYHHPEQVFRDLRSAMRYAEDYGNEFYHPVILKYKDDEMTGHMWESIKNEWIESFGNDVMDNMGNPVNFAEVVELMDEDIKKRLNKEILPCSNQAFFDIYCIEHEYEFGEPFYF